ncbi:hypothetical protein BD769DRAFT_1482029 [Suillus cothurnatus]|nr:hypothetical protein BD769DRAFT_1482029 [Suillus cothurnatus]
MVPFVQWPSNLDASAVYARLRDHFRACSDREELFLKYGKAMAHLRTQTMKIKPQLLSKDFDTLRCWGGQSHFISDAFVGGQDAYRLLEGQGSALDPQDRRNHHLADVRTALRTIVAHGQCYQLSPPDDENLIWEGDLRWCHSNGRAPSCEEFDWLIDYLTDTLATATDDESEGDAVLALSAMGGLGSSAKRPAYIRSLVCCMDSAKPPRVRHAALRAVFEARNELASLASDSMPQGVDTHLLDALSRAILTAVRPYHNETIHDKTVYQVVSMMNGSMLKDVAPDLVVKLHELSRALRPDHDKELYDKTIHQLASMKSDSMPHGVNAHLVHQLSRALLTAVHADYNEATYDSEPDTPFHNDRDYCYVRLIYTLSKNDEWCQRLARDDHLERCTFLVHHADQSRSLFLRSYLPALFGRIDPEGKHHRFSPDQEGWRQLISNTWQYARYYIKDDEYVDGLPAVVTATRLNLPGSDNSVQRDWLAVLAKKVNGALGDLQQKRAIFVDNGVPPGAVDTAIFSMQGMYADLRRMIEDRIRNTTYRDNDRSLGP